MKTILPLILISLLTLSAWGQKADDVLATATGHTFRVRDLSAETQKDVANLPIAIPKARAALLDQMINQKLVTAESKARSITIGKLLADEKAKVPATNEAEIKKFYDENQA